MADSPVATPHVREDAPSPARTPGNPDAAAPDLASEAAAQALLRAFHPAAGAGAGGGSGPPPPATWTPRPNRVPPRDLVALQRLAGNRAVTGLMARPGVSRPAISRVTTGQPLVQRQPAPTKAEPKAAPDPDEAAKRAAYPLTYRASSMDQAVRDLLKDASVATDVIVIGVQPKSITIYNKMGMRIAGPLKMKLPEGLKLQVGVFFGPSPKMVREEKRLMPMQQVMVDEKTKDWFGGRYTSFVTLPKEGAKNGKMPGAAAGASKDSPQPGTAAGAPAAAPGGAPAGTTGGTGTGTTAADVPGAPGAQPATAKDPKPVNDKLLRLTSFVKDAGEINRVLAAHDEAVQFYLVPDPPKGQGKLTGGSTTGFAGEVAGDGPPPNAPPWPVSMDGPRMQPADSEGVFSSRINWAANNNNAFSDQVISAVGSFIHYRWEVFDITEFAKRNEAKLAAQAAQTKAILKAADEKGIAIDLPATGADAAAKPAAPTSQAGVGGPSSSAPTSPAPAAPSPTASADVANATATVAPPVATGPDGEEKSLEDVIAEKASSKRGSGVDPSAETRDRKFKRSFDELSDDTGRAWKDLKEPSGSTWSERQSNAQANMLAIELLPVSFVITSLGATLRWVTDFFGGPSRDQEVHFGSQGVYLVRVIATPNPTTNKDGEPVIRPSSVATRVVEVVRMGRMLQEALDDPKAQVAQAQLDLDQAKKSGIQDRIDAAQEAFDLKSLETEGDPLAYLRKKIAVKERELARVKKKYEGVAVGPILDVEREIDILHHRMEVFELQEGRRVAASDTVVPAQRVNAALVSEVTGQTYPLMLSVGPMKGEGNRHRWKLIDATGENAEGFDGYGVTPLLAIKDAFRQFGGQAQYGRGKIGVRLPTSIAIEKGADRNFETDSLPIGWAIAKGRLDDLVMTLAALGLFVTTAGTASIAIGAAVAAARLISRLYNGTLRFDAGAVSDVLAILGAVGAAAGSAAKVSVKAAGVKFEKVGSKLVMLEEGAAVGSTELANATKALQATKDVLKGIEAANEVLNYAGVIWGNVTFFNEMLEISQAEAKGPENGGITRAEARRRRAIGLSGAINNNGMFIAPNLIKARQARKAAAKTGAPSETPAPTGGGEPTPAPDATPVPGEPGVPRDATPPRDTGVPGEPGGPAARREPPAGGEKGGQAREAGAPGEGGAPREQGAPGREGAGGGGAAGGPAAKPRTEPGGTRPGEPAVGAGGSAARPAGEPAPPKPGSARERAVAHKSLQDAARSGGDLTAAANDAIGKGGTWKEGLKAAVSELQGDHRVNAEKALVEARERIVNEEWAKIEAKYPDLRLENAGTKSFTSDIDATVRPKQEATATGPKMAEQVETSARAAQELADALRKRVGGETDAVIDTNIYSFIGEGRVKPGDAASKGAQQHVDMVAGLAEQMRGQTDAQYKAFEKSLLEKAGDPRVAEEVRRLLGQATEFHDARQREWNSALDKAGVRKGEKPTPAQERIARESILGSKKGELSGLLGTGAPNYDAVARKQAEINWFAPDAYATPSAFKQAVAHGQRLKGTARPAAEWTGAQVAGKLREAAGKLPPEHPQAKQYQLEAGRVESQQRLLEMTVKELQAIQDSPPVDLPRVRDLEARAKGLQDAIAHSAEQLVVAQILGETMPAGRGSADRLSEAAAASAANMGMLEAHVSHAKDIDGKVKAAAKYAGRIAMAEFLGGLRPGMEPVARLIGDFVKSRWGFLENVSPQIMRDMFVRYARLTGRHTELAYNARGDAVGASDALKAAFVKDVMDWARTTNREIQTSAIGAKAFDNPTPSTPSLPGAAEPAPKPGTGGGPDAGRRPGGGEPGAGEPGAPARPASGGGREQPGRAPGGPDETAQGPTEAPAPREPLKITKAGGVTKAAETPVINPPGLNQPFEFRIASLRDAETAIRKIANGDPTPLSDRGIQLGAGYKTQGREWGLAQMPDGSFAIVQGDIGGVSWGDLPRGTIPLAHTHPITPERALSKPATVRELIEHYEKSEGDPKLEQDAVNVFQSPEDVLLVAANRIANHDVHTGYVHTGDGVLKTPTGAQGEMQVSFNLYDARHIGDSGSSPVVEAAFTAHDDRGNVLHLGRVTVVNFEPNTVNPRTMMVFRVFSAAEKAKLSPPNPANLLPMHATPMASGRGGPVGPSGPGDPGRPGGPGGPDSGSGGGAGGSAGGPATRREGAGSGTGAAEDTGPATRREGAGSAGGEARRQRPGDAGPQAPVPAKPAGQERVPGGVRIESDDFSTTARSRTDPNALARIETEDGGVFKMTDVQKRDLASGSGSGLLAEALLAVRAGPGNTLIIHGIINKPTLEVYEAKGDPATSLLGRMSQRALEQIGLSPRTMKWEIIRGKLCIVIAIQ